MTAYAALRTALPPPVHHSKYRKFDLVLRCKTAVKQFAYIVRGVRTPETVQVVLLWWPKDSAIAWRFSHMIAVLLVVPRADMEYGWLLFSFCV